MLERLLDAIQGVCSPEQAAWLGQAPRELDHGAASPDGLSRLSAQARRRLGRQLLGTGHSPLDTAAGPLPIEDWEAGDAGRVALLLTALRHAGESGETWVAAVFRRGDESERAALARGLALFFPDDRLKPLALEAGRANSLLLTGAVSLRNPYPAAYYSEAEFNQLVLKALFTHLGAADIMGLERRANPELSRMCADYVDELTAAGREVPPNIWLALMPHATPAGLAHARRFLAEGDSTHRRYAALAMVRALGRFPELRAELDQRRAHEPDEDTRGILAAASPE